MTRLVNNSINSLVQVVDSNGDKVTDAIVNYKVYFYDYDETETWIVATSGLMTHIGDGLYQAEWTPQFTGEYTFYAYSTNPKFHESYTYFVEAASTKVWVEQEAINSYLNPPVQNEWVTLLDAAGGVKVDTVIFYQLNDETGQKNIEFRIYPNDGADKGFSVGINHNDFFIVSLQQSNSNWTCSQQSINPRFFGRTYSSGVLIVSIPFECRDILIQYRITSALGTNQKLSCYVTYSKLESV